MTTCNQFGTRRDETIIATENFVSPFHQSQHSKLKKIVVQFLEWKIREKLFSSGERQHEQPSSGAAAAERKTKGTGTEILEITHNGKHNLDHLEGRSVE